MCDSLQWRYCLHIFLKQHNKTTVGVCYGKGNLLKDNLWRWGAQLLSSARFGTQQRAAFILLHTIKDDAAQTAVVQSSDPSLDFKYLSIRKGTNWIAFLMDNIFLFPPFLPAMWSPFCFLWDQFHAGCCNIGTIMSLYFSSSFLDQLRNQFFLLLFSASLVCPPLLEKEN